MSAYSDRILGESGLVAYWRLGEAAGATAVDEFGTNDGNYVGTTKGVEGGVSGDPNTAVFFDGVDDQVQLPAVTFLTSTSSVTVEFWNKFSAADLDVMGAFDIGLNLDPNRCLALVPWSDGTLYWDYGSTAAGGRLSAVYTPYMDKWTHVCCLWDNSNNFRAIYLDGLLAASATSATAPIIDLVGGTIGLGAGSPNFHRGTLDEFALYNVALTPEQIFDHFLAGAPQARPPTAAVYLRTFGPF